MSIDDLRAAEKREHELEHHSNFGLVLFSERHPCEQYHGGIFYLVYMYVNKVTICKKILQ